MTQKQFVFSLNIPFQVLLRKFENIEGPGSRECAVCIWMGGAVGVGGGGGVRWALPDGPEIPVTKVIRIMLNFITTPKYVPHYP